MKKQIKTAKILFNPDVKTLTIEQVINKAKIIEIKTSNEMFDKGYLFVNKDFNFNLKKELKAQKENFMPNFSFSFYKAPMCLTFEEAKNHLVDFLLNKLSVAETECKERLKESSTKEACIVLSECALNSFKAKKAIITDNLVKVSKLKGPTSKLTINW